MIATSFCNRCEKVLCLEGNFQVQFVAKLVGQLTICDDCLSKVLTKIAREVGLETVSHGPNRLLLQSSEKGGTRHLCLGCWQWTGEVQPNVYGELICRNCL